VRARLLNLARQRGEDFQITLRNYLFERFLYRLGRSPVRERFVLKGAMLAAAFDTRAKRVFSSNGDGRLSVIQQDGADRFKALGEVTTFLVTGDYTEIDPTAKDPRKRYAVKPGSTRMLLLDPVP
jgi:hypothetical protein